MTPTTEEINGSREKIGELRGELSAIVREMALLQENHRQLQQQFIEVSQEFATHIASHLALDKAHDKAETSRHRNVQTQVAIATITSGLISTGVTLAVTKML